MIRIFPAKNRSSVNWAGGTSTEIFIHPSNGSFAERDFDFRISTATVEVEESDFTFCEGITRHLMILQGELELNHVGRYEKHLNRFEQDTFFGEWPTKSRGKVTDFNLMLKNGFTGSLEHFRCEKDQTIGIEKKADWDFVFVAEGSVVFEQVTLRSGDLLLFSSSLQVNAGNTTDLILISVLRP